MFENFSFFDGEKPFKFDKPIRLIELFGGYGSQALSLKYSNIEFEHWKLSEWAVPSIQAYKDLHFTEDNTDYSEMLTQAEVVEFLNGRISSDYSNPMTREQIERKGESWQRKVYNNMKASNNIGSIINAKGKDLEIKDTDKYCYVMSYSFPCQDLSSAGLGKGMARDSGTRSGVLWEVERLLTETEELPQVLLMENVPEVIGSNNVKHFAKWVEFLEKLGYKCKWQCLNAKNYGIPQNRDRCFMVSILGDYYYDFPQEVKLTKWLKDVLEEKVDESFYLSEKAVKGIENTSFSSAKLENRTETGGNAYLVGKGLQRPETCNRVAYDEQNQYIRKDNCVGTLTTDGSSPKHNNRIIEYDT